MVPTDVLLVCSITAALFAPPTSLASLTSLVTMLACIYRLKTDLSSLRETYSGCEIEGRDLKSRLKALTESKLELEGFLQAILDNCSQYFCVYSEGCVKISSASFSNLAPSVSSFWNDHLHEDYRSDFYRNIACALKGESVSMKVKLKQPEIAHCKSVLPLSPMLDAILENPTDAFLDLEMKPTHWVGKPAVLIHVKLSQSQAPVGDFIKTFNHEFRTPLNIIIGLSDLMLWDSEMTNDVLSHRQRLVRQCACTLLATINSIIHQCEVEWKVPTGLHHVAFAPELEVREVVLSVKGKLEARGNVVEIGVSGKIPEELWGNVAQFRHVISFMILTCSNITQNDTISLNLISESRNDRCDLHGEISASCPAVCSRSDFNSVLQLFSAPAEDETSPESYAEMLRRAERQALLNLSVAREMCKLFFGDMQVRDGSTLNIRFFLSFSRREQFILKRKGNIFADKEEFVRVESPIYSGEKELDDVIGDLTPAVLKTFAVMKYRSETHVMKGMSLGASTEKRRCRTSPSSQLLFDQLPSNSGDSGAILDSPGLDSRRRDVIALIAEDVPMNAAVLSDMLKRLGLKPVIASNGAEAVSYVQAYVPEVIFMDCMMPIMDGLEATRRIREMNIKIPIIAVTASGPEKESECRAAGMTFFISKPVRFASLTALLRKLKLYKVEEG